MYKQQYNAHNDQFQVDDEYIVLEIRMGLSAPVADRPYFKFGSWSERTIRNAWHEMQV